MKYIFLAAGKGTRLQPLTLMLPKCMYRLDKNTTVLKRMTDLIRKYDAEAEIVVVTGYMHTEIEREIKDVEYVFNPFYAVTNSIASLWFAKEHLLSGEVVLLDGDIVLSEVAIRDILCKKPERPCVLLDSSIKNDGDYNVEVADDRVLVMSKNLKNFYGEYAGITKLDKHTAKEFYEEVSKMIEHGYYEQWYEDALVQMIFNDDLDLYYEDICDYKWTEVDEVDDLLCAKNIQIKKM